MHAESATILWGFVLALHLLGMAVWVGGAAYVLIVLRPSLALLEQTHRVAAHLQSLKRFFRLVWHVMPVVLLTGWAMEIFRAGGFAHADWRINAMQGLGVLMAIVFVAVYFGAFKRAQRAIRPKPAMFESIHSLVGMMLALGIVTVIVACLDHSW